MKTIFALFIAAAGAGVYVFLNFFLIAWLLSRDWKRLVRIYNFRTRKIARAFASPQFVIGSISIALFTAYALYQLRGSTNLWWSSFILLCVAVLPIWIVCRVIEKIFRIKDVAESQVNRIGMFVVIGFLFWFAKIVTADEANSLFPFDPGLIPFGMAAGVFLALCGLASVPAAFVMLVLEILSIPTIFDRVGRKKFKTRNYLLALATTIFYLGVSLSVNAFTRLGLSDLKTLLIARIAFEYDFNDHYLCHEVKDGKKVPLEKGRKVVFIGPAQDRGISAIAEPLPNKPIREIDKNEVKRLMPKDFGVVVCNQPAI